MLCMCLCLKLYLVNYPLWILESRLCIYSVSGEALRLRVHSYSLKKALKNSLLLALSCRGWAEVAGFLRMLLAALCASPAVSYCSRYSSLIDGIILSYREAWPNEVLGIYRKGMTNSYGVANETSHLCSYLWRPWLGHIHCWNKAKMLQFTSSTWYGMLICMLSSVMG